MLVDLKSFVTVFIAVPLIRFGHVSGQLQFAVSPFLLPPQEQPQRVFGNVVKSPPDNSHSPPTHRVCVNCVGGGMFNATILGDWIPLIPPFVAKKHDFLTGIEAQDKIINDAVESKTNGNVEFIKSRQITLPPVVSVNSNAPASADKFKISNNLYRQPFLRTGNTKFNTNNEDVSNSNHVPKENAPIDGSVIRKTVTNNEININRILENRLAAVLKEFEGNLTKILQNALINSKRKTSEIHTEQLRIPRNHRPEYRVIEETESYELPRQLQSNPTISGPPSLSLIGRQVSPIAEAGYGSPPNLNLNSNGGTLDYTAEDSHVERGSQEAISVGGVSNRPIILQRAKVKTYKNKETKDETDKHIVATAKITVIDEPNRINPSLKTKENIKAKEIIENNGEQLYRVNKKINQERRGNDENYVLPNNLRQLLESETIGSRDVKPTNYIVNLNEELERIRETKEDRNAKGSDKHDVDLGEDDAQETTVYHTRVLKGLQRPLHPIIGVRGYGSHHHGYNSLEHLPPDPYVALLLSHYGRYLPTGNILTAQYRNLYSYLASNNIHNNKPFGSYKIYEDSDS